MKTQNIILTLALTAAFSYAIDLEADVDDEADLYDPEELAQIEADKKKSKKARTPADRRFFF